ncbi:serine/threonine-protein kinase [Geodermatophilus tzadiensis]|uniref:non-specific serine/threonine protein kinase n=1 Tax=Geodermatophilus tzadiensis TaxID=1137988 RepID=A0A2T0TX58_9ACTN|nr:serine/threonine-protein kinase [Geodermatophilus tzadiensis]PRY50098.1 serine/threonine-protein kinase [Geodermatophilus tzadiensis]
MTTVERGRQILGGRYELQELIATGGMGQVWRGRDGLLGRTVAVKVLRSEYADDATFLARFRAEARHAAALSHPNIAAVLDYGETQAADTGENVAYLVMELVEGAPLSALLSEEGPLPPDAALSVLSQAAAGLAEAHRAGLVHRDVKPGNILVRPDGGVKLTDFGIAWSAESVPLTRTGQVIGTAQYMSPEQAEGRRVSPASDVYALGLVGYESLTGHPAFEGTNPVTVALKQVREDPEPLPADVPPGVRHLIDAALTKDPRERLPDGDAFLHAIEETVTGSPSAAPSTPPVPSAAGDDRGARRRLLVALAVLAVVLLGGGAVALAGGLGNGDGAVAAAAAPSSARGAPTEDTVVLDAAAYVGRPVEEVAADLADLGLTVGQTAQVTADADPGTVTALDPAGRALGTGDRVEVTVAASPPAPAPEEQPAPAEDAPAPAPEPSAEAPPADTAPAAPLSETAPTETAPTETAPTEAATTGTAPTDAATTESTPTDTTPTDATPTDTTPTDTTPTDAAPTGSTPTGSAPTDTAPTGTAPTDTVPSDTAPDGGPTPGTSGGTPEDDGRRSPWEPATAAG